MSILFKIRSKPPNISLFVYVSAFNPDCAIVMHLHDKVKALVFIFFFHLWILELFMSKRLSYQVFSFACEDDQMEV